MQTDTFTYRIRERVYDLLGSRRRVTFRYRFSNGKLKKVSGRVEFFGHLPDRGFFFMLNRVRMRGRYFPVSLVFYTRRISWALHHPVSGMLVDGVQ